MGTMFPLAGFTQKALAQSTALPMEIALEETSVFYLRVPDSDVTRSAYGGKLKLYDAHVAKMFEVTQYLCKAKRDQLSGGYTWIYEKNDGRGSLSETRIGMFEVSCRLANDIASAYGEGNPESTTVDYGSRFPPRIRTYSIPILNITGDKVDTWLDFVSNFKPVR